MSWRESALIEHARRGAGRPGAGCALLIPSGDDMAMLRLAGSDLLAAVDQTIDGRHVDLTRVPPDLVARKAINRCISDVAAMAARPCASLVAGVLPPDFGDARAKELIDALHRWSNAAGAPMIGGDLAMHAQEGLPMVLSVTVLAVPGAHAPVRRSGAQPGDCIAVTGALGGSLGADGMGRHLTFVPRVAEALELSALLGPHLHAMIDISDGLGRDLFHLTADVPNEPKPRAADESEGELRMVIDESAIPCSEGMTVERALGDGEDYELLFTTDAPLPSVLRCGTPVTIIGRVERGARGVFLRMRSGEMRSVSDRGWQHGQ